MPSTTEPARPTRSQPMRSHATRRGLPMLAALLAGMLLALAPALAVSAHAEKEGRPDLAEAQRDLAMLEDLLDDRDARAQEIETYMGLVMRHAKALRVPESADGKTLTKAQRQHAEAVLTFREDVIDALLDAMDETDLNAAGVNDFVEVNAKAGLLLAKTRAFLPEARDRKRLSRRILKKIKRFEKARHDVAPAVFGGAFDALAALGDERALAWVIDNYLHTRKRAEDVARMKEAMQALRHWDPIPGARRYELVDEMLKLYVAVEDLAGTSKNDVTTLAAKRFWDQIRLDAIPLIQRAAGYPAGTDGAALATMAAYKTWFREHDGARDPAWKGPAPAPRES